MLFLPRLVVAEGRESESESTPASTGTPGSAASGNPAAVAAPPATTARAAVLSPLTSDDDLIGDHFRQLVNALEGTDREASPKAVSLTPEVYAYRLEPREVVSYRRLFGSGECDRSLEQFLIECAALRVRINEEAEEITSLLDETAVTRDAPVFGRARLTARLADAFVQRFSHFIDQAVQDGNFAEAQGLQLLRMRLIRDYSGLWLLVNRPTA